jgi:hypothetical protein
MPGTTLLSRLGMRSTTRTQIGAAATLAAAAFVHQRAWQAQRANPRRQASSSRRKACACTTCAVRACRGTLPRHRARPSLVGRLIWPAMLKLLFSPAAVPRYFEQFESLR